MLTEAQASSANTFKKSNDASYESRSIRKENGASALADERIVAPGFEPVIVLAQDDEMVTENNVREADSWTENPAWSRPRKPDERAFTT